MSWKETTDFIQPGPVFRVSPNELSFASTTSWKAIYGLPAPGQEQLIKGELYDIFGAAYKTGCIGSERDPAVHSRKKKNLTAAFSSKALAGQESIVQACLDGFITKLGPLSRESGGQGINVVKWLEMVIFDILGEMAFGESFGCVEKGNVENVLVLLIILVSWHLQADTSWDLVGHDRASPRLDGSDP